MCDSCRPSKEINSIKFFWHNGYKNFSALSAEITPKVN